MSTEKKNLSPIEKIKEVSQGLRGTLKESLKDEITGAIREDDTALVKFHGMYMQDDRDRREDRAAKKLERLYSFMIRLRLPGGFMTPEQYIATHNIAGENSTGVIKITTRQTLQLHGIVKAKTKPTIKAFNQAGLDSIAACGDVNRNVVSSANPLESPLHERIFQYADRISEYLLPKTRSYYDVWLDEEKIYDKVEEEDPLYQDRYLPRKFKIGLVIPPNNDSDVFAQDLGLIAIIENGELQGFNLAVGGGLSFTHGNQETYPRLATEIGFVSTEESDEKLFKVVYEVLTVQRDFGNRADRKLARLKYTVDNMGLGVFRAEVEKRTGFALETARSYELKTRVDHYGWAQSYNGLLHYTVFVENGRVTDLDNVALKTAMLEVAQTGKANFRFTCNQNVILSDITRENQAAIEEILVKHNVIPHTQAASLLRKNAMACVALPTCPLALAEAQRYLPELVTKIDGVLETHGLLDEEIIIRMTGCPNGCGRSVLAEIGFVGTAPGRYNLHLGGDEQGQRLNKVYRENLDEAAILQELDTVFFSFKQNRTTGERFGDFAYRTLVN
ncbi:NADPH-dependent assimilatory sulfite reductase hemoprotein subunit [Rufibacter glacialis]|uniref:assimilatory sulfite reductase (NADPH) n=1 Tax=Rufibacter glacialis TaxID=1259555 RepID=A0A5M8QKC4_9BACT|nr:NADPH-dependent assimilatory sulfite reductase hemoprotein subunit [Rufibacter glacialis]KAA6435434.1 NADPH-dependent assimilatory sulfite reductase hemoprotein subunit [Rufibacter glacialis]GGK63387.1 sulfite reductase [NADPH] hemoprotein beta-component [Rufibacter glacialis]